VRRTLSVFDEDKQEYTKLSLFPEDRPLPDDAVDSIQVRLSGLELRRPRPFGNCWLASELWHQLGLTEFWRERLPEGREAVSWEKVLRLLVVNRLLEPGSEFRLHRHWFVRAPWDALLESDFQVAEKDRLYRLPGPGAEHKQELFVWLKQKWAELFAADFEVLLYDLTSTLLRGRDGGEPESQAGLQSRQPAGLFAGGDRAGGDAGRLPAGVRSDGRQHQRAQERCGRFWITSRRPTAMRAGCG